MADEGKPAEGPQVASQPNAPDRLHAVMLIFGPTGTQWNLLFRSAERAAALSASLAQASGFKGALEFSDDFGTAGAVEAGSLHAVVVTDLEATTEADVARTLHQLQTQKAATLKAQAMRLIPPQPTMPGAGQMRGFGPRFNA